MRPDDVARLDQLCLLSANCQRSGDWIIRNRFDQPTGQGVPRMQLFRRQEHFQRSRFAYDSREPLRASPPGDKPERRAAMAKDGMRSGNATRARQRQVEATAHAIAMHSCDGRSREVRDSVHETLAHLGEVERLGSVQLGNLVEIGARGEEVGIAGEHEA